MNDTDLDQAIHEQLERLVADAPLPPSVDDITAPTVRVVAIHRRRPLLVGAAAGIVLLAVVGAIVLRAQGDDGSPPANEPAGPRAYGVPQDPPPGAGDLPRLVVSLPGWVTRPEPEYDGPFAGEDSEEEDPGVSRAVAYGTEAAWSPIIEVTTTTAGYGLGIPARRVEVQGHAAVLGEPHNGGQHIGWRDGDETVSVRVDGFSEAELVAMAESLIRDGNGQYVLPEVPDGLIELFRTEDPAAVAAGTYAGATFIAPDDTPADQGFEVEVNEYGGGPEVVWHRLSDKLFGEYESEEMVTVRGNRALLAESDGDYRVIWAERDGDTAVEVTYSGDRATLDRILDSLIEVDEATWQALRADPAAYTPLTVPDSTAPVTTAVPVESVEPDADGNCPDGYLRGDDDGDGVVDDCLRYRDMPPDVTSP